MKDTHKTPDKPETDKEAKAREELEKELDRLEAKRVRREMLGGHFWYGVFSNRR